MERGDFLSNGKAVPRRFTERYLLPKFPDAYRAMLAFCDECSLGHLPLQQKIWHFLEGARQQPKCVTCGKVTVGWKSFSRGYATYCSPGCMARAPEVISRRVANTDYAATAARAKETNLERYGVECVLAKGTAARDKMEATNLERYGNKNPFATEHGKAAIARTNLERHGNATYIASLDGRSKAESAWGGSSPFVRAEVLAKARESTLEHYGVDNYFGSSDHRHKQTSRITERLESIVERRHPDLLDKAIDFPTRTLSFTCPKCGVRSDGVDLFFMYLRAVRYGITPCVKCLPKNESAGELALYHMVVKEFPDAVRNVKFDRLEIDVYVPSRKIGFEFNGLFWHREAGVGKMYHLTKSEHMEARGIKLFHVWEDDMVDPERLRSRVLNSLGKSERGIGARKLSLRVIPTAEAHRFCEAHHLYGGSPASYAVGAFDGAELKAVMTFGTPRFNENVQWELLRFCCYGGNHYPGVASRLFTLFRSECPLGRVLSYADRAWTFRPGGSLYEKLGFRFESNTPPSYWYIVKGRRIHRMSMTKKRLAEMGGTGNTEADMAESLGLYRVYNLGHLRFVHEGTAAK
jgi:hypothetical protein